MRARHLIFAVIGIMLCLGQGTAAAEIYQYRDAYGRVTLSDKPLRGQGKLEKRFSLKGKLITRPPKGSLTQRIKRVSPILRDVAAEFRLQPELLHAIVRAESAYDTHAVSSKGAVGLMQLMPATARRYGVSDRRNARDNLRGGARYFKDLLALFKNDLNLALAAYNAGENAVIRYGRKIPPYPETERYVEKVRAFFADAQRETIRNGSYM